jgi:RNA polymerase sigma-70 factor, ECF subfamily
LSQEKKIIEKLNKRDPEAFESLYKEYKTIVYNYLLIKTKGDADVSKDILSETFCSLMENAGKIKNLDKMKNFLLLIANRRLNDFLRKKYRIEKYDKYLKTEEKMDDIMAENLHTKKQLLLVNMAIDDLKPLFKDILKLKYIEEKSQKEISLLINKTESSVETLLVRARKQLRIKLKKIKGFINEF